MAENLTGDPRDEDAWMWSVAEIEADPQGTLEYINRLSKEVMRLRRLLKLARSAAIDRPSPRRRPRYAKGQPP